jgi:protein ImuB
LAKNFYAASIKPLAAFPNRFSQSSHQNSSMRTAPCRADRRAGDACPARRLDLLFYRVNNIIEAIRAGTAKPLRDTARLTRLLTQKLETVDPGFGIEEMVLSASLTEPLDLRQCDNFGQSVEPDLSALVETLANRTGVAKLYRAAPAESDLPQRSVQILPPLAPPAGAAWPKHWPRPSRLLSPPEPVDTMALLPDRPPAHFTWRGIRRHVAKAMAPSGYMANGGGTKKRPPPSGTIF